MNSRSNSIAFVVLVLFMGCAMVARAAKPTCPAVWPKGVSPLPWSAPSTWETLHLPIPVAGSNVTIPPNVNILFDLDDNSPIFNNITISAGSSMYFDGSKPLVHLKAMTVMVLTGALFQIGSPTCLYTNKAIVTLFGAYNAAAASDTTIKSLNVHGTLELHGAAPGVSWTHLATTALQGATSITLTNPVDWVVGDEIAMASTDFDPLQSESFFITARISAYTFQLDHPIQWTKWAGNPTGASWDQVEKCEVGILTRNIVIQGDNQSDVAAFGGHVIGFGGSIQRLEGVEYRQMGMSGMVARYPVHWHFVAETNTTNQYLINSAIHDCYLRCATVHHTNSILLKNNVAFNTRGHCFYLEDGWEQNNTFDGNLAILATAGNVVPTDGRPSMFWITNPNNVYINNVAVGGAGGEGVGFWYSLPASPINFSYSTNPTIFPVSTPIKRFYNNTAHSTGWCVAIAEPVDVNGNPQDTLYTPNGPSLLEGLTLYKCLLFAAWLRTNNVAIVNAWMGDSSAGYSLSGSRNTAQDIVMVGLTSNVGYRTGGYGYGSLMGTEGYDNGGSNYNVNLTCYNYFPSWHGDAACISSQDGWQKGVIIPTNVYSEVSIPDGSNPMRTGSTGGDGASQWVSYDQDGSWLGTIGASVLDSSPLLRYGRPGCNSVNNGEYYVCPPHDSGYTYMTIFNNDMGGTNFGDVSSYNGFYMSVYPFGDTAMQNAVNLNGLEGTAGGSTFQMAVPLNRGYVLKFPYPTPPALKIQFEAGVQGDYVLFAIPYPAGTTFRVQIRGGYPGAAGALAELTEGLPWFFDSVNELLYVKYYIATQTAPFDWPGMYDYSDPAQWLYIYSSNCGPCAVSTAVANYIPPAYNDGSLKYEAILCTPSGYAGKAYFSFGSGAVYYNIHHAISNPTSVTIGTTPTITPFSPSRGVMGIAGTSLAGVEVQVKGPLATATGILSLVPSFGYNNNTKSLCSTIRA